MKKHLDWVMPEKQIRVKAMCLFINNGKVLAAKGRDDSKNQDFYRVIGGTVEFGETGEEAIRREVKEELASEIENLKPLPLIENIFTYEGKSGHQITFLFRGELSKKELYNQEIVIIKEPTYEIQAYWVPCQDIIDGKIILYPSFDYAKLLAS